MAFLVSDKNDLKLQLKNFIENDKVSFIGRSTPKFGKKRLQVKEISNFQKWIEIVASEWVLGENFEWRDLYNGNSPNRISLPTYSFENARYWVKSLSTVSKLHPLLHAKKETIELSYGK